jgi:hypothetical protein
MSEEVAQQTPPELGSPEWTEYVLSLLRDDEKYDEYPTVNGLRRLTNLLVGRITGINSELVQQTCEDNGFTAVVKTDVQTENGLYYSALADANPNNCNPPYSKFLAAMAEARAEGRVFRRMLSLNIACAEEMPDFGQKKIDSGDIPFSDDMVEVKEVRVNPAQLKAIDVVASRFNISVLQVLEKKGFELASLTFSGAQEVLKELQSLQKEVPVELQGYNKNWSEGVE